MQGSREWQRVLSRFYSEKIENMLRAEQRREWLDIVIPGVAVLAVIVIAIALLDAFAPWALELLF